MENFDEEISNFTQSIWQSTLSLEVKRTDTPFQANGNQNTLAGSVQITGEWKGSVIIHCSKNLAQKAAAIMFSEKEEDTSMEDIKDALGELANMTGGNIKSLLPEPCYLSLPAVAVTDHDIHVPGSKQVVNLTFECENIPFMVTMVKKAD